MQLHLQIRSRSVSRFNHSLFAFFLAGPVPLNLGTTVALEKEGRPQWKGLNFWPTRGDLGGQGRGKDAFLDGFASINGNQSGGYFS